MALLAYDLCYYWAHRLGHEVSILWAAHAVHHQSEDYNLSTALRQTSTGFLFRWVFYLPLFILGMPFEVFAIVSAIDLIYQFWVHTQHIGKLGWLDYVFVTPSNHRVHHAQNQVYLDRNYGGILVIWDRLFGTFQVELDREPVVFGVRKPLQSWDPFKANLQVYQYLWFDAVRTADWRDKLAIWFRQTGWRPADIEAKFPKRVHDPDLFRKFDPEIDQDMRRYLLLQYTFVVAMVLWIGVLYTTSGLWAVVVPCLFLWTTLYSVGVLSEGKLHGPRIEMFRLVLLLPAAIIASATWTSKPLAFGMIFFAIVSLFLLPRPKSKEALG